MIALKMSQKSEARTEILSSKSINDEDIKSCSEDEDDLTLISKIIQHMILKRNQN